VRTFISVLAIVLIASTFQVRGLCKDKINPEDFTLSAAITAVSSRQEVAGITSQRHSDVNPACTTIGPEDPRRARMNCDAQAAGDTTTSAARSVTRFVLTALIADKVYDLEGPRIELAAYRARFVKPSRGHPADVESLAADKKATSSPLDTESWVNVWKKVSHSWETIPPSEGMSG
jgi:hypothetical protein